MADWCPVCCTRHTAREGCLGELYPRAPEKQSKVIAADTPRGVQGYAVLLAPVLNRWRARIMSIPNVLWTIPGGRGTMKFIGRTEEDAERQAIAYIREHCMRLGFVMRDELALSDVQTMDVTQGRRALPPTDSVIAKPRFPRILPVRFGPQSPNVLAKTANLSESGLFVNTGYPLHPGTLAGLLLELEHVKLPLRGSVIWNRPSSVGDRPSGMGIELQSAPETYRRYIQTLGEPLVREGVGVGDESSDR